MRQTLSVLLALQLAPPVACGWGAELHDAVAGLALAEPPASAPTSRPATTAPTTRSATAEELKKVERKIQAAWDRHKSITATWTIDQPTRRGGRWKGTGTVEVLKKDGKVLSRIESKAQIVRKAGVIGPRAAREVLSIVDGEYAYNLTQAQGRSTATKSKIKPKDSPDPKVLFASLRPDRRLDVLPEETIDGQKVYVIAATTETAKGRAKMVFYFLQESGVLAKVVALGADGKPVGTSTYTDFKFDVDIDPERFVFEPPPGVQVIDRTGEKKP